MNSPRIIYSNGVNLTIKKAFSVRMIMKLTPTSQVKEY